MSQDIVDSLGGSWGRSEGLIVACGVEGEFPDQGSVLPDDPDVFVGDQELHRLAGEGTTKGYVVEATQIAECDSAIQVDLVGADAVVGSRRGRGRPGLEAG